MPTWRSEFPRQLSGCRCYGGGCEWLYGFARDSFWQSCSGPRLEASPIATQMARTVQEYNHEMACLVLTIPESAASDKYFEYSIAQATYRTPSGRNTFVGAHSG